jgi:hypothetical protein
LTHYRLRKKTVGKTFLQTQRLSTRTRPQEGNVTLSSEDLDTLATFESDGQPALSIYLDLTTAAKRNVIGETFQDMIERRIEKEGMQRHRQRKLQEDMTIVQRYLQNGNSPYGPGVVIFSCASHLFWRAFILPVAVTDQVDIGPRFNLEPLREAMKRMRHREELLSEAC